MAAFAAAALVLFVIVAADAQDTVRIRGTIEAVTGDIYSVRTRDDKFLRLRLATNANVAASVRSATTDVRPARPTAAVSGARAQIDSLPAFGRERPAS